MDVVRVGTVIGSSDLGLSVFSGDNSVFGEQSKLLENRLVTPVSDS